MNLVKRAEKLAGSAGGGWLPADAVTMLRDAAKLSIEELMLQLIPLARTFARPVFSGFSVGAVAEGASGALYFGANFEFPPSLHETVHAEQATVVNAATHEETGLLRLAVSAPPCGHCRQFLYELAAADELQILLAGRPPLSLRESLPSAFGPMDLGVDGGLLAPQNRQCQWLSVPVPTSASAAAALRAATRSYAPYTQSACGVGLTWRDGQTYGGAYFENAAFNPSLGPLSAAIVAMELSGRQAGEIVEAALVCVEGSLIDHATTTRSVLQRVAPHVSLPEYQVVVL